jgi:hypothetical protein
MWNPIETAPKTGEPILGFAEGEMATVKWHPTKYKGDSEYWTLVVCGSYAEDGEWWPTHWMPLPAPPVLDSSHQPEPSHVPSRSDPP